MTVIPFANAGNILAKQSAINAVAQQANDWERKLLGLHCGQMLDRTRHKAWAARRVVGAQYAIRRSGRGVIGWVIFGGQHDGA